MIIVGCGRVGAQLAQYLDTEGHEVTIVDERVGAFNRLGDDFRGNMIVGDGTDESVLRRAGITEAQCFASVTNGDNRNIMAAQIAKEIFGVRRVITRIYDPMREATYRELGLETICTTTLGADLIRKYLVEGINSAHPTAPS